MSDVTPDPSADSNPQLRPIQLMLVDEDPVFRLGLKVWLEQRSDFVVVAEAGSSSEALSGVRSRFSDYQKSLDNPALRKKKQKLQPPIDLVILDLGLGSKDPNAMPGLSICQQIKTDFPQLPVLVLSAQSEPVLQAAAKRMGASAYGTRSMSVRRLAQLIRESASNAAKPAEPVDPTTVKSKTTDSTEGNTSNAPSQSQLKQQQSKKQPSSRSRSKQSSLSRIDDIPGPLTAMRISMRLSGLRQIDQNMVEVEIAKQQTTSWLDRVVLDGKKRELVAARWLMSALWRTPGFDSAQPSGTGGSLSKRTRGASSTDWIRMARGDYGLGYSGRSSYADRTAARYLDRAALTSSAQAALANIEATMEGNLPTSRGSAAIQGRLGDVQNAVFEGVFAKLQRPLKNVSETPLEIDILRADKKLELLYLVLRQLEELLSDLRASQLQPGQLLGRSQQVLSDLWDAVNIDFFGKYYTVRIGNVEEEVITVLQREKSVVQTQILSNIPLVSEMFGHWLFQEPMTIESESYLATTPEAIAYSERLLENLTIQVANAVIQPLLNRMADSEPIKKNLYTARLMSSREIEKFRNDLSWRYRLDRLVNEPKAVFESRYNIFVFASNGINQTSLYAPRRAELDRLTGIPLAVTLALETRDALSPRLRKAVSLVGSGVVYLLTEVLGRGIGLIGRGIFQGMGSAWRDSKVKQRRARNVYTEPRTDYNTDYNTYAENAYAEEFNEWE